MRIAVTGASGFIGRHMIQFLSARGIDVVAVTRDAKRLSGMENDCLRIVEYDLALHDEHVFDLLSRPDALVHLAWDGLPNYQSLHHFETELPRQFSFLKSMVHGGLQTLLVTGTCFEYGMKSGQLSEHLLGQPGNPYGYAKDALRRQLTFLQETCPFALIWARLFYMYGEGQSPGSLYPLLCRAVAAQQDVFNMTGGEQLRDYLPISEVVRLLALLAEKGIDAGRVNICSGMPISVRKLVEDWIAANHWDISLNLGYYPYSPIEPMAFWGDRRYLDTLLGTSG